MAHLLYKHLAGNCFIKFIQHTPRSSLSGSLVMLKPALGIQKNIKLRTCPNASEITTL